MEEPDAPQPIPEINHLREKVRRLRLQKLDVTRKASRLEWFKASAVLVAFLGLLVTFGVGENQIKLTRESQITERFDRALARISSDKVAERLMGVSSLKLFLLRGEEQRYRDALYFLVHATTFEEDPSVQRSILAAFSNLSRLSIDKKVLDEELTVAVELNRNLTSTLVRVNQLRQRAEMEHYLTRQGKDLTFFDESSLSHITEKELAPLLGTSNIIVALIHAGASNADLSSIFCDDCDFSRTSLPRANFNRAHLLRATFALSDLHAATFINADIAAANFYRAA